MHLIAGQSEDASFLRMMRFVKIAAFQKGGADKRGATIMYSMRKIMCFFTLNHINIWHYTKVVQITC